MSKKRTDVAKFQANQKNDTSQKNKKQDKITSKNNKQKYDNSEKMDITTLGKMVVPQKESIKELQNEETVEAYQKKREEKRNDIRKRNRVKEQNRRQKLTQQIIKRRQRPKFLRLAVRCVAISEVICIVVLLLATVIVSLAFFNNMQRDAEYKFQELAAELKTSENPQSSLKSKSSAYLFRNNEGKSTRQVRNFESVLIDTNEKPMVADSSYALVLEMKELKTKNSKTFLLNIKDADVIARLNEQYSSALKSNKVEPYDFIPSKVTVEDFYQSPEGDLVVGQFFSTITEVSGDTTHQSIEYYGSDASMEDANYKHFVVSDMKDYSTNTAYNAVLVGTPDCSHARKWLKKNYNNILKVDTEYVVAARLTHFFADSLFVLQCELTTGTGKSLHLVSVATVNLWAEQGMKICSIWLMLILLSALISLFYAKHLYDRELLAYEMDEYRRSTTNAMAHDLKSPLMVISGYTENLREETDETTRAYYMDQIEKKVCYINQLVEDILQLSKVEQRTVFLQTEKLSFRRLFETVLEEQSVLLQGKNLTYTIEGEWEFLGDERMFTRAIYNLVNNAIKYSKERSQIQIVLAQTKVNQGSFTITNESETPLEDAFCKKAFDPFVKGDASRSGQSGTGVGLAIVKEVCSLHELHCEMNCDGYFVTVKIE